MENKRRWIDNRMDQDRLGKKKSWEVKEEMGTELFNFVPDT